MKRRGQVLPLFAIMLVGLMSIMALAIDVASAYAFRQAYRTAADAAALASAQDLQGAGTYATARARAVTSLVRQFGATSTPTCADNVDCALPGTPYVVKVKTPLAAGECVTCTPSKAVKVTVANPTFNLTFARVVGISSWRVAVTSVAGFDAVGNYALVTLRPPHPIGNGSDQDKDNVDVNGRNTRLFIESGDVGTNTSVITNSANYVVLAPGYSIFHYDNIIPDPWNKMLDGTPTGVLLQALIPDPNYMYPTAYAAVFPSQAAGETICPTTLPITVPAGKTMKCYLPGEYQSVLKVGSGGGPDIAYLTSGAYKFSAGANITGSVYGGLSDGPGVVVVVPKSQAFDALNAVALRLNSGDPSCTSDSCRAKPALDGASKPVVTPDGLPLTIEVIRDESCFTANVPKQCSDTGNTSLRLSGQADFYVAGVIYGPSDYMRINANDTVQGGTLGRIVAWHVSYGGGPTLNQKFQGDKRLSVLRLDQACSPGAPCTP